MKTRIIFCSFFPNLCFGVKRLRKKINKKWFLLQTPKKQKLNLKQIICCWFFSLCVGCVVESSSSIPIFFSYIRRVGSFWYHQMGISVVGNPEDGTRNEGYCNRCGLFRLHFEGCCLRSGVLVLLTFKVMGKLYMRGKCSTWMRAKMNACMIRVSWIPTNPLSHKSSSGIVNNDLQNGFFSH